jgi:hypothetical protein
MKIYAESQPDLAIMRIVSNIKKYAPPEVEFVDKEEEADIVIMYAYGQRRGNRYRANRILARGQQYSIMQLCLRNTTNPRTEDWMDIWYKSKLVWSYYNLPNLMEEDGNRINPFPFYFSPLGVDTIVFKETKCEKKYLVGICSHGLSRESLAEVKEAAKQVGGEVFHFGVKDKPFMTDKELALELSQCKYVTGLRRHEGFELPVLEGAMCGARPICFDIVQYRQWFEGLAMFIPQRHPRHVVEALVEIFKGEYRPVSDEEKQFVAKYFNWENIVRGYWNSLL